VCGCADHQAPGVNLEGLKNYLSSMRFDKLKSHAGPLRTLLPRCQRCTLSTIFLFYFRTGVTVDKVAVTLSPGVHYFLEPAQLVVSTPSVQSALCEAGFGDYVASVKA
jgi:hypothetical protein